MSLLSRNEVRATPLKVALLGDGSERTAEVKAVLEGLAEPKLEVTESARAATPGSNGAGRYEEVPDVVMVMLGGDAGGGLDQLVRYSQGEPRPVLFALLPEESPNLIKQALRAGADETLFMPLHAGDTTRAMLKVSESRRRVEKQSGGNVISVMSLTGGVGVTSFTMNLALALRYRLERRVAVVDLDLQTGTLGVMLNVESENTLMALSGSDKVIDSIQLEAILTKSPSGIYVISAPKHVEQSEMVSESTVERVLDVMREMFDFVLVDCGNSLSGNVVAAWERSDRLFYLLDQSIAGSRCAFRFIEVFNRLGLPRIKPDFIMSRFMPNYTISAEQVSEALSRPIFAKIPRDDRVFERVELSGKDIWQSAPNSAVAKTFEEIAERLVERPMEVQKNGSAGGVVSRLVSAIVSRAKGANDVAR